MGSATKNDESTPIQQPIKLLLFVEVAHDGRVVGINIARAERIASYALPAKEIQPWIEQYVNDIQEVAQRR